MPLPSFDYQNQVDEKSPDYFNKFSLYTNKIENSYHTTRATMNKEEVCHCMNSTL